MSQQLILGTHGLLTQLSDRIHIQLEHVGFRGCSSFVGLNPVGIPLSQSNLYLCLKTAGLEYFSQETSATVPISEATVLVEETHISEAVATYQAQAISTDPQDQRRDLKLASLFSHQTMPLIIILRSCMDSPSINLNAPHWQLR